MLFEWDKKKEVINTEKHGVDFETAKQAFFDPLRITAEDIEHSTEREQRYFCFGPVNKKILTVRSRFERIKSAF